MKHRQDNTFIIEKNNMPYQVVEGMAEYQDLLNQYNSNPGAFEEDIVYKPTKEEQLDMLKVQKHFELKKARNEYLKLKNYDFSENDKFNIMNLIGYTEEERQSYLDFIKNDLKPKYDEMADSIDKARSIKSLNEIVIDFNQE